MMFSSLAPSALPTTTRNSQNGPSKVQKGLTIHTFKGPTLSSHPYTATARFDLGYRSMSTSGSRQVPGMFSRTSSRQGVPAGSREVPPRSQTYPPANSHINGRLFGFNRSASSSRYGIYPSSIEDTYVYERSVTSKSDVYSNDSDSDTESVFSSSTFQSEAFSNNSTTTLQSLLITDGETVSSAPPSPRQPLPVPLPTHSQGQNVNNNAPTTNSSQNISRTPGASSAPISSSKYTLSSPDKGISIPSEGSLPQTRGGVASQLATSPPESLPHPPSRGVSVSVVSGINGNELPRAQVSAQERKVPSAPTIAGQSSRGGGDDYGAGGSRRGFGDRSNVASGVSVPPSLLTQSIRNNIDDRAAPPPTAAPRRTSIDKNTAPVLVASPTSISPPTSSSSTRRGSVDRANPPVSSAPFSSYNQPPRGTVEDPSRLASSNMRRASVDRAGAPISVVPVPQAGRAGVDDRVVSSAPPTRSRKTSFDAKAIPIVQPPPGPPLSASLGHNDSRTPPPIPTPHRRHSDGEYPGGGPHRNQVHTEQNPSVTTVATTRSVRWHDNLICPSPILPHQRRKGWFNRRGDQLWTNEGAYKPPEDGKEFPLDLDEYPEPGIGWRNEEGVIIDIKHRLIPKQPLRSALKRPRGQTVSDFSGPRVIVTAGTAMSV